MSTMQAEVLPSNLTYRQRLELAKEAPPLYNQLYDAAQSRHANVWERLHADSGTRRVRTQSARMYRDGRCPAQGATRLTGFVSNSTKPSASYTLGTFKNQHAEVAEPVENMHPMVAQRFKKRDPIGFLSTIRPDAQTTSQTMRMLGTYAPDREYADAFGVHIPHVTPGGNIKPVGFHPDTVLGPATERLRCTVPHKGWQHASIGLGFTGRAQSARR